VEEKRTISSANIENIYILLHLLPLLQLCHTLRKIKTLLVTFSYFAHYAEANSIEQFEILKHSSFELLKELKILIPGHLSLISKY